MGKCVPSQVDKHVCLFDLLDNAQAPYVQHPTGYRNLIPIRFFQRIWSEGEERVWSYLLVLVASET